MEYSIEGSSTKSKDSISSRAMEGFNNDDIRTPSPGVNINVNELLVLPGEIVDDYMIRWGNRHKQTSIQEM